MANHTVSSPASTDAFQTRRESGAFFELGGKYAVAPDTPTSALMSDAYCLLKSATGVLEKLMQEDAAYDTDPLWAAVYLLRQSCGLLGEATSRGDDEPTDVPAEASIQEDAALPPVVDFTADRLHAAVSHEVGALQSEVRSLKSKIQTLDAISQEGFGGISAIALLARRSFETPDGASGCGMETLAQALTSICDTADRSMDSINAEAEEVDAAWVDPAFMRRCVARDKVSMRHHTAETLQSIENADAAA